MDEQTSAESKPWENLERLIASGEAAPTEAYIRSLGPAETARAISRLASADQVKLLDLLGPVRAAAVLQECPEAQTSRLIENLRPAQAAAILDEMKSDRQADVLGELGAGSAAAILTRMEPAVAEGARELLSHPPDTAGGIMITEFVAFRDSFRVIDVVRDLRVHGDLYSDYEIQYVYVVSETGVLRGVLRLRDLLFARSEQPVVDVMIPDPLCVSVDTPLEQLERFFEERAFLGVPVTDAEKRLVGVVQRAAVERAADRRASSTFLKFVGFAGREELRSMPIQARSSLRLSWLTINVFLNIIAASVIAVYQETLSQAIVLAVFLPIISDMSGCSGNQAVAVSIRELTLGLVKPHELAHVLLKEVAVGVINGVILGLLLGAAALLWKENAYLGLVVGGALALNTIVAVALGGLLPLVLRGLRFDPALASGPILTTVTDMCGFFIMLSSASLLLSRLGG